MTRDKHGPSACQGLCVRHATEIMDALAGIASLVRSGKVRAWGVASTSRSELKNCEVIVREAGIKPGN